jgi:truncated hemoglobin YjbI
MWGIQFQLGYFAPELFNEWLSTFKITCKEIFKEEVADLFIIKAEMIATTLKARLYQE